MSDGTASRPAPRRRERARVQRENQGVAEAGSVPRAHDHLERLLADRDLLLRLQLSGYADAEWRPVAEEFARYGMGVLPAWIATGRVYTEVRAKTDFHLHAPEAGIDEDTIQNLATDAVVAALKAFREVVLPEHKWDPARGASLKTFFIGQCVFQFANVYRKWRRQQRREPSVVPVGERADLDAWAPAADPPDRDLLRQEAVALALELVSTDAARRAFVLQNMGYSLEEIAADVGLADAKAVENAIGYQRRRLQEDTA